MFSGIIATYTSWRVIFGVSAGITFWGGGMAFFFVPKRSQLSHLAKEQDEKKRKKLEEDAAATAGGQDPRLRRVKAIVLAFNPMTVFRQWKFPSILLANLSCGFLAINHYGLIVSVRHIINPRFQLTSPLYSGMFYLAPGVGFLLGSLVGGNASDRFVRRYKAKRGGVRLPEDRLNSNLIWSLAVLPLGTLVYGWSVDKGVGGLGLPISFSFVQGFGLMAAFSVLNTYAAEVNPDFKMAVISGKYVVQYSFGAIAVGGVVPMIDAIGSGWTFTICKWKKRQGGCFHCCSLQHRD
jgi:MFS family permease